MANKLLQATSQKSRLSSDVKHHSEQICGHLLRNVLYFGSSEEALPLSKKLVALMAAQLSSNQYGRYVSIGAKDVNTFHAHALALNELDLLEALSANVK